MTKLRNTLLSWLTVIGLVALGLAPWGLVLLGVAGHELEQRLVREQALRVRMGDQRAAVEADMHRLGPKREVAYAGMYVTGRHVVLTEVDYAWLMNRTSLRVGYDANGQVCFTVVAD